MSASGPGAVHAGRVQVRCLGSGDAFASGGRLQACYQVAAGTEQCLIDCGPSALIAMRRFGVDPTGIDAILLSHLHGDHFAGVPFFLLDAQLNSKRTTDLVIAGPPGTTERIDQTLEILFPGVLSTKWRFLWSVIELVPAERHAIRGFRVGPFEVVHPAGDPALALRIECADRVIAYSGDTGWTESLVPCCRNADLLIAECSYPTPRAHYHLDLETWLAHLAELQAKRVVLTHMSQEMLNHQLTDTAIQKADDGMTIRL